VLCVLVGAIAGNCSDARAIHLCHRVGQAVGHYVIRSATKIRKKMSARGQKDRDGRGYVFVFWLGMKRTACGVSREAWVWCRGGRRWGRTRNYGDGDGGDEC
jgi:hypothetical protein